MAALHYRLLLMVALTTCPLLQVAARRGPAPAADLQFRVRTLKLTPDQPALIHWRFGGEGLTAGDVHGGVVTQEMPKVPDGPAAAEEDTLGLGDFKLEDDQPKDRIIVKGDTYDQHFLRTGVWSRWQPITHFRKSGGQFFVTFMITGHETGKAITDAELEFEFYQGENLLKRFTVAGPDGPTFGILIPFHQLDSKGQPTAEFIEDLGSLYMHVQHKQEALRSEPWIEWPIPALYGIITDCSGYRPGQGYGIRTTHKPTMLGEFEVLRLMGFNGIRGAPGFLFEQMTRDEGLGSEFQRLVEAHANAATIPRIKRADGRPPDRSPGDGCPSDPANIQGLEERGAKSAQAFLARMAPLGADQAWGLTIDEIGSLFGGAPEGKAHMGSCPHCRRAFREMIKADGRTLEEFGATSWEDIRATSGYWATDYFTSLAILQERVADAERRMKEEARASAPSVKDLKKRQDDDVLETLTADLDGKAPPRDPATELLEARQRLDTLVWNSRIIEVPEDERQLAVSDEGWALLQYYTRRFNAEMSARVFEPLQQAYAALNAEKQAALERGETSTPTAKQPWIYSFALRGNNFLMGGHSLGFFDFYRHADNAMVYETSNRDARVWQWDSYLCDVGRSLHRFQDREFGIYVKPHRGAPIQRALAAVARGTRMIFWYTYGPEWKKGDTWGGRETIRRDVAWANRLIAAAEPITYDGDWAVPAEVAIVRPRTAEFLSGSASWENGKWVYTALQHAHIPVDPLDEHLLEELDLSGYKVIVISGSHLRRSTARKLKEWVAAGGTLYTCGWGMARDEADRPLTMLHEVFGVEDRQEAEFWGEVPRYGATSLRSVQRIAEPPSGARVNGQDSESGQATMSGSFMPVVGREVLKPVPAADIMATYEDGSPAAIRHRFGQGTSWLIGTYAGVEYAWETMQRKPFDADKRSWIAAPILAAGVSPVVDADEPLVEGILMQHPETKKRAVILINWAFHLERPVQVRVRTQATMARSVALDAAVPIRQEGEHAILTLPRLDQGDVILLD